jgi:transcription elongation factor GreA
MTNFITPAGLKVFEKELAERLEKRRIIAKAIKSAKEQGDLSENAEYSAAKAQQRENEGRINWLVCVIDKANVVEKKGEDKVELGCLVDLARENQEGKMTVQLVGTHETDPANGKISHQSPIGQAIIGKKKGDQVEVETPNGKEKYQIKDIK